MGELIFMRRLPGALLLLGLMLLAGCFGTNEKKDPVINEILPGGVPVLDAPEDNLYRNAKQYYGQGEYTPARQALESLKTSYPLGPYTQFAEIKLADSQFEGREYEAAALLYEEFAKNYPFSEALPYARLRAARSHQLSHKGVGRDPTPLEKSLQHYDNLIKDSPSSVYAASARTYRKEVLAALVEYEELVTDYYRRRNNINAADARQEKLSESLLPLLETAQQEKDTGITTLASLGPPQSALVSPPPRIITARATQALKAKKPASLKEDLPITSAKRAFPASESVYTVVAVTCSDKISSEIYIYLNKAFQDRRFISENALLMPKDGVVTLTIPETRAKESKLSCFAKDDVTVSAGGVVTIKSDKSFDLLTLNNPPRLLLVAS